MLLVEDHFFDDRFGFGDQAKGALQVEWDHQPDGDDQPEEAQDPPRGFAEDEANQEHREDEPAGGQAQVEDCCEYAGHVGDLLLGVGYSVITFTSTFVLEGSFLFISAIYIVA